MRRRPEPHRTLRRTLVCGAAALLLIAGQHPAQAKDVVVASVDPADATALAAAPAQIVLTCTGRPDAESSHVSVRDATGRFVDDGGDLRADGDTLRLPVTLTGTGDFTVVYHVVLASGADAVGVTRFSVGTGVAPPVPPDGEREAQLASAVGHQHGDIDPFGATLLAIDAAVVFAVALLLIFRPRRRLPRPPTSQLQ
ncbi:copper resistance protein CopC [Dactylosporangium sp. NPDC051485]|uniref:copper resistance protein CopC n=1 Tax=Dactylosporangium sp. NPDC051485 TaxID=3154846 RepID=UPI00342EF89B